MNANEVLANRAAEILGGARGEYTRVHPNDHVNMGQSTNDVFPDGDARWRCCMSIRRGWSSAARALAASFERKADEFAHVLKVGRTHLQDAVPMTLGQEFSGYAACVARGADDVEQRGAAAAGAEPRRHGGRHRAERRRRLHGRGRSATSRAPRACRSCRRANRFRVTQSMGDVVALLGRDAAPRGRSRARSRATCGCSAWDRARASPRSRCRRCSPARRSCRAR